MWETFYFCMKICLLVIAFLKVLGFMRKKSWPIPPPPKKDNFGKFLVIRVKKSLPIEKMFGFSPPPPFKNGAMNLPLTSLVKLNKNFQILVKLEKCVTVLLLQNTVNFGDGEFISLIFIENDKNWSFRPQFVWFFCKMFTNRLIFYVVPHILHRISQHHWIVSQLVCCAWIFNFLPRGMRKMNLFLKIIRTIAFTFHVFIVECVW